MAQQTIPNRTWTRLDGTDLELHQTTGTAITIDFDPEAGTVTVPLVDSVHVRSYIEADPANDDPIWADKVRAIRSLPFP